MPNWCRNRVDVYSENKTDLQKVLDIFNNKNVFAQIIPEPNWAKIPFKGELPKVREMKSPNGKVVTTVTEFSDGTQDTRWYDWRLENWDTKWDVHDAEIEEERWENELESFTAEFQSNYLRSCLKEVISPELDDMINKELYVREHRRPIN